MSSTNPWAIFRVIAEERIADAYADGRFDNLPGYGKPLELEDDSMIPEENRMGYKILKNAGHCPPEVHSQKDTLQLAEMLSESPDAHERHKQLIKLSCLTSRIVAARGEPLALEEHEEYHRKVVERVPLISRRSK